MSPLDAFVSALMLPTISSRIRGGRPGEVIEAMPKAARAALQALTSDDVASLRVEWWWMNGSPVNELLKRETRARR